MKKPLHTLDDQKSRQNPNPTAVTRDVESRSDKSSLSDNALEQISAAGEATVPTMNPEVLLGRHARPDNTRENKP